MTTSNALQLVSELFAQLRQRGFELAAQDLDALRLALQAGFGWESRDAFRELIVALWAKTTREAQALRALFERLPWPEGWTAPVKAPRSPRPPRLAVVDPQPVVMATPQSPDVEKPEAAKVDDLPPRLGRVGGGLPEWPTKGLHFADARLIDVEMFPLNHREVAQAFRRLRRPARFGPPTELDVEATVALRLRRGVITPPVMMPRRQNTARLVVFVDVKASVRPYRPFVDMVCDAVLQMGLLHRAQRLYFHDIPCASGDHALLDELPVAGFAPVLDSLLASIPPGVGGEVYVDAALEQPVALADLLRSFEPGTSVLIIGDAGAATGSFDISALYDWLALFKALRGQASAVAWLNPVPRALWARCTAAQVARHLPMFPLDRVGVLQAVNALRGQPVALERPL